MPSSSILEYIITHVFLPPKLPQEDDSDSKQDSALIEECRAALSSFQARLPDQERWRWVAPIMMLSKMLDLRNPCGHMLSQRVELSLGAMEAQGMPKTNIVRKMDVLITFHQACSPFTSAVRMRASSSEDYHNNSHSSPSNSHQRPRPSWRRRAGCGDVFPAQPLQ